MKKKVMFLAVSLLLGLAPYGVYAGSAIGEIKPYGYFWFRATYMDKGSADADRTSEFAITRGYLRFKTKLDHNVEAKVTLDIAQKHGATAKSDWQVRLKYAHVDIGGFIPEAKIRLGLQKTYFGVIDQWEYPLIEKSLEDKLKYLASADLGVGIVGYLPQGYGDYAIVPQPCSDLPGGQWRPLRSIYGLKMTRSMARGSPCLDSSSYRTN